MTKTKERKRDIYQEVTDRIIQALEKGVGPWIRPWRGGDSRHRNAVTGRPYRGINTLLLNLTAMAKGYTSPLWLTYREAKELGGYVKKGEEGTKVVFWKVLEVEERDQRGNPVLDPETGEAKVKRIPFARYYTVFNIEQCENLDWNRVESESDPNFRRIRIDGTMPLVEQVLSLPRIGNYGDRAYYDLYQDLIVLPFPWRFDSTEAYYSTALHETVHWTGHKSRLNRQFGQRFGDLAYAFEELVAEMGSAFLCAYLGVEQSKLQHPEYIANWLQVLKNDKRAVFTAARKAQEASDWLLEQAGLVQAESEEEAKEAA